MTDLPPGWEWAELADLVDVLDGQRIPVSAAERAKRPGNVPYYGATGQVGWIDRPLFNEELLLLGEDGVQFFDVNRSKAYLISGPAWVNNHAHVLRVRERIIDRRLLLHYLNVFDYHGFANGTTRLKLTQGALRRIPVPLPPLAEQQRIVVVLEDHLSRLDAGLRLIQLQQRRMRSLWQSVLGAVATGSILGSDQQRWRSFAAGDVTEVQGGIQKQPKRRPVKNRFSFLRVANVTRTGLDLREVHEIELFDGEIERFRLHDGDLLVVEGNGSIDQIGRAAMWREEIPNCVHQNHLIRVRPGSSLNPGFLELVWNAPTTVQQLKAVASSTSGLHTLSTAKVKAVRIPVPSMAEQVAAVDEAARWRVGLDRMDLALQRVAAEASALRKKLLAEAFAGQLARQDPSDESASELQARLRAARAPRPRKSIRTRGKGAQAASPLQEYLL